MNIQDLCVVETVDEHSLIKPKILEALASQPTHTILNDPYERIHNTDWDKSFSVDRSYFALANKIFEKHFGLVAKKFNVEEVTVANFWFQQYMHGDYHYWHLHPKTMFSSIYFVELPDGGQTQFTVAGERFSIPVKEGQILTFPSIFVHCSPPNKSSQRKTVIVFNTNVDDVYENIGY